MTLARVVVVVVGRSRRRTRNGGEQRGPGFWFMWAVAGVLPRLRGEGVSVLRVPLQVERRSRERVREREKERGRGRGGDLAFLSTPAGSIPSVPG